MLLENRGVGRGGQKQALRLHRLERWPPDLCARSLLNCEVHKVPFALSLTCVAELMNKGDNHKSTFCSEKCYKNEDGPYWISTKMGQHCKPCNMILFTNTLKLEEMPCLWNFIYLTTPLSQLWGPSWAFRQGWWRNNNNLLFISYYCWGVVVPSLRTPV